MKQIISTLVAGLVMSTSGAMAAEKTQDTVFNPFEEIQKMQKEMEHIFERFQQKMMKDDTFSKFRFSFPATPALDLIDEGDVYVLKTDIPGVEKRNLNIIEKDGILKIEAQISKDKKEESKGYLKRERFVSSYMRMVTLPGDANTKKLKSEYKDGVLTITIPKKNR
jgi:HSP20 family protein